VPCATELAPETQEEAAQQPGQLDDPERACAPVDGCHHQRPTHPITIKLPIAQEPGRGNKQGDTTGNQR
jgi:hypothetical protein